MKSQQNHPMRLSNLKHPKGLNTAGKLFFGGLTLGTFGLGCWQSQRYFDKIEKMEERQLQLSDPPIKGLSDVQSFHKRLIKGKFRHQQEILMGPRGPPPGALAVSGPSSGRSEGGMSSGPQGYYVITPFELCDDSDNTTTLTKPKTTLLLNRGWIPRHYPEKRIPYDHPEGILDIVAVVGKGENPRFMMPPHDFDKSPPRLYWMDQATMEDATGITEDDEEYNNNDFDNINNQKDEDNTTANKRGILIQVRQQTDEDEEGNMIVSYPVAPPADAVGEFKVRPMTHAGYAFTWYGLAVAGVFMTRSLVTRGRM